MTTADGQSHDSGRTDEQVVNEVAGLLATQQVTFLQKLDARDKQAELRQNYLLSQIGALIAKQDGFIDAFSKEHDRLFVLVEENQDTIKKLAAAVIDLQEWRDQFATDTVTRLDHVETGLGESRRDRAELRRMVEEGNATARRIEDLLTPFLPDMTPEARARQAENLAIFERMKKDYLAREAGDAPAQ